MNLHSCIWEYSAILLCRSSSICQVGRRDYCVSSELFGLVQVKVLPGSLRDIQRVPLSSLIVSRESEAAFQTEVLRALWMPWCLIKVSLAHRIYFLTLWESFSCGFANGIWTVFTVSNWEKAGHSLIKRCLTFTHLDALDVWISARGTFGFLAMSPTQTLWLRPLAGQQLQQSRSWPLCYWECSGHLWFASLHLDTIVSLNSGCRSHRPHLWDLV